MSAESDLASRVRAALQGVEALREVKMFGGVGFLVNGNLVAAASKRGLLLRVGRERQDEALAQPGTRPMEMRGRRMEGYVYADPPPSSEDAIKAGFGQRWTTSNRCRRSRREPSARKATRPSRRRLRARLCRQRRKP